MPAKKMSPKQKRAYLAGKEAGKQEQKKSQPKSKKKKK